MVVVLLWAIVVDNFDVHSFGGEDTFVKEGDHLFCGSFCFVLKGGDHTVLCCYCYFVAVIRGGGVVHITLSPFYLGRHRQMVFLFDIRRIFDLGLCSRCRR